ncbi:ERG4/ERG24 ergosterol biosynthesis protein, partial [Colletotrichum zoysiae]
NNTFQRDCDLLGTRSTESCPPGSTPVTLEGRRSHLALSLSLSLSLSVAIQTSSWLTRPLSSDAFRLVFGLPLLLWMFYFICNEKTGCPAPSLLHPRTRNLTLTNLKAELPWPTDGILGFCSWEVFGWTIIACYLFTLLFHRILPAHEVFGMELIQSGRPLKYRFNSLHRISLAFSTRIFQLVGLAIESYLKGAHFDVWTFISDNYLQLLTANIILSFDLSTYIYIASFSVKPENSDNREIAADGNTRSAIYGFWVGRELNPCATLTFGRLILNLAFCAKQDRNFGYLSDSICYEVGTITMMNVIQDGMGFMLGFGDVAWVPFLYSTQTRFLSIHPVRLGWPSLTAMAFIVTRLLNGGRWGISRHIKYLGDWIQALPLSLPTAVSGCIILPAGSDVSGPNTMFDGREVVQSTARSWGMAFTHFYIPCFATLLIHRE